MNQDVPVMNTALQPQDDAPVLDVSKLVETPEVRATRLLLKRGRSYFSTGRRYITLTFHSSNRRDAELIAATFGGNVYHHSSGYQWRSSNRMTVDRVRGLVKSIGPSDKYIRWRPLMLTENYYVDEATQPETESDG